MSSARSQRRLSEMYSIAVTARSKLQTAADEPDHCLRRLCGHANMLDVLMEDLSLAADEENISTPLGALLLDLDGDSESESDEDDHNSDEGFPPGSRNMSPVRSVEMPQGIFPALEEPSIRPSARRAPLFGHAYDLVPSRKAQRYELDLQPIGEYRSDEGDCESCEDEDEVQTPEDENSLEEMLPSLPSAGDGALKPEYDLKSLDHALIEMETEFGSELERVESWRDYGEVIT